MQQTLVHKKLNFDPSKWELVNLISLSEDARDKDIDSLLTAGSLFQPMPAMILPAELLKAMTVTVRAAVKEAIQRFSFGRLTERLDIRLFWQPIPICGVENQQPQNHYGWSYYLIDKGGEPSSAACQESCRVIELYLYQEGNGS